MTPEAVFAAYRLLSFIPPEHVIKMRRALDTMRRRASVTPTQSAAPSHQSVWSPEDAALVWLVDITRDCWCLWPLRNPIH